MRAKDTARTARRPRWRGAIAACSREDPCHTGMVDHIDARFGDDVGHDTLPIFFTILIVYIGGVPDEVIYGAHPEQEEVVVVSRAKVRVGRVYDEPTKPDGVRVLVDRLWPRGLTKTRAGLDEWCKQVAPSAELRRWYGHDPALFGEFRRRYRRELGGTEQAAALAHLRQLASRRTLTLLTASKDVAISEATVLAELINEGTQQRP
jgi:uncharacterized protein YeaO (DUF488 family)